jgi:hypothetical protein
LAIRIYNPTDLSTKTVLFYDYGLFICIAEKLAEKFGKVYYYTPWKNDFPTYETAWIGRGARGGVERIKDFFEVLDKLDKENTLIFFPDIYNSDLQEDLRRQGYRMIGAGEAEKFERDKWLFKKILKELGLPVANTVRIVGLKHLRELLSGLGNKWLKTSEFRGDFETREHVNMERTNMWLDKITCKMVPPRRNTIEILVEDPIEGDVEPGVDMFLSNGVPSEYCTIGYEVKGVGMISRTFKTQELPKNLKSANDKVIALMPEYKGPYSAEFRIDKNGTVYYVDPAMRFGSPLAEMQCEFYDNFAESMWEISEGKAPSFRPIAKYAVQIVMYSEYLLKRPIIVEYPEEAAKWFKMRDYCIVDGITYCIPNPSGDSTVGSVFGFANNLDEAIKLAEDRTDKINGDGLTWDTDVGVEAKKYIKDGEKHGIYF